MEKKEFEIIDIEKDKKEVRENFGVVTLGAFFIGLGIVGLRYFGEIFYNSLKNKEYINAIFYGGLSALSIFGCCVGDIGFANTVPVYKESVSKLKKDKKQLKLTK